MRSQALHDDALHEFLRRRRRGSGLVQLPPLGRFLAETLDLAARLVPSQAGSLLLDDPARLRQRSPLTFVAAFGPAAEQLVGMRVPRGRGVVGRVYRTGGTYRTSTVKADPHFFGAVDDSAGFRTRSLVAAPVRLEESVCGVFELVNRRGRRSFSDRDVELVELIAQYISRAILNAVDILKRNELALRDDLTGLRNARGLEAELEREIRAARKTGRDVAVMYIDVDRLKRLNDRHGHRAGSEALRRLGRVLGALTERGCMAFRLGGDEFVLVFPSTPMEEAGPLAERIRRVVARKTPGPMRWGGRLPALSVSIGVATLQGSLRRSRSGSEKTTVGAPRAATRLLTAADHALYRAKRGGRGRIARATARDDTLGRKTRSS